jgi:hypothetical protein
VARIVAVGFLIAGFLVLANPRPAAACSCVSFQNVKQYATPQNVILTGTVGDWAPRGVSVQVDRWFWGVDPAIQVWLAADSFGDGAACGTTRPNPGTSWLWIAWRSPTDGDLRTGLCSPAWDLSTDEGQAQLAAVTAVFSGQPPPEATAEPVATTPDPAAEARDRAGLTIGVVLLGGSLAMFAALGLVARRNRRQGRSGSGP